MERVRMLEAAKRNDEALRVATQAKLHVDRWRRLLDANRASAVIDSVLSLPGAADAGAAGSAAAEDPQPEPKKGRYGFDVRGSFGSPSAALAAIQQTPEPAAAASELRHDGSAASAVGRSAAHRGVAGPSVLS